MEAVVTVVDVNGAFTIDEADSTLAAGEMKIAGVYDDDTDVDGDADADAGNNNDTAGDNGSDVGDDTGTPVKTVLPNGCALGDGNNGVTSPGEDALFTC